MNAQPNCLLPDNSCVNSSFEASYLLFENLFRMQNTSKQKWKEIQHGIKDTFFCNGYIMILNEGSVLTTNLSKSDAPFES